MIFKIKKIKIRNMVLRILAGLLILVVAATIVSASYGMGWCLVASFGVNLSILSTTFLGFLVLCLLWAILSLALEVGSRVYTENHLRAVLAGLAVLATLIVVIPTAAFIVGGVVVGVLYGLSWLVTLVTPQLSHDFVTLICYGLGGLAALVLAWGLVDLSCRVGKRYFGDPLS